METSHEVHVGDARGMDAVADDAVELVVTSPPYPMIEMWDDQFAALDPAVGDALSAGDADRAYRLMHDLLDEVWAELRRVLVPGGIACVNVGDATRKLDDRFRVFPNHARVTEAFADLGFDPLPDVLWRKPTNSPSKFMGSGMLPPNAYVTLEHEYVLVFRNGGSRSFEPHERRRYESAYFYEERNEWFTDLWEDVQGTVQELPGDELRERSAAFPLEIPYRLVNMYSVYGDTVLDPFLGTGTTSLAAMLAGRNSVGYELVPEFEAYLDDRADSIPERSARVARSRLRRHREFVADCRDEDESVAYEATHYDFPVKNERECDIRLYAVEKLRETPDGYRATHAPVEE